MQLINDKKNNQIVQLIPPPHLFCSFDSDVFNQVEMIHHFKKSSILIDRL